VILSLQGLLLAAAATTLIAIPVRLLALRLGILDRPASHKSHSQPVPYLGGLAIWGGLLLSMGLTAQGFKRVLALLTVMLVLGLLDDLLSATVPVKLVVEGSIAVAAVGLGFTWHLTDSYYLNAGLSVLWMVGLTNSFNLLDNMDGLSSTVGATALLGLAIVSPSTAPFTLPLAGALLGFLAWNRPPARIYMGDAGSLMVGMGLAIATIDAANQARGVHSLALLVGPIAVAVFDTSLVVVSRILAGRPIQVGGRDHFSHRLQRKGWTRPQVLGAAFAATVLGSTASILALSYPSAEAWLAFPIVIFAGVAWVWLLRANPYAAEIHVVGAKEATGA
jgi:UDP-GlcNAc:undecaprenyl-phosphate/decaprenyl-phosphate GlcNAc-1-phosphate transferase